MIEGANFELCKGRDAHRRLTLLALLASASSLTIAAPVAAQEIAAAQDSSAGDVTAPPAAEAADAGASEPADTGPTDEAITVTGTRITRDGYQAPTPVTVQSKEDLQAAAPESILRSLTQLPQLVGTTSPYNNAQVLIAAPAGTYLNLRGIGAVRTLNMLDGMRIPVNTYTGVVDTSIVPQLLVSRVDIVTGGASAAYGSDAVSGVVNFILDKGFNGLKVQGQGGISTRGDRANYRVGIAGGFDIGDRGHLLFSFERAEINPILWKDRRISGELGTSVRAGSVIGSTALPGSAANPYSVFANSTYNLATAGSVILAGPFKNIVFPTATTFRPAAPGQPTGTSGITTGSPDFGVVDAEKSLTSYVLEQSAFVRGDYDFTDDVSGFVQVLVSTPKTRQTNNNLYLQSQAIFSGNPYIPADLQAQMTAQGVESFNIGRFITEIPASPPAVNKSLTYNIFAGLKGSLGNFKWDLTYARGYSRLKFSTDRNELRLQAAAADAVRDPATGNIVCRVTLTNPDLYPGCVPVNLFGVGSPTPEALDYFINPSTYTSWTRSNILTGAVRGDLFSLPAGPVSVALGAEYRTESLRLVSNADPAINIPVTGLRGIAVTSPRFYQVNTGTANGRVKVKEVFGELVVPVFKDSALGDSFDINGAARYTDYSTSGGVTTWKIGATWEINPDILIRASRSRDIRAPNTFELFAGTTSGAILVADPHTGLSVPSVLTLGGGNPDLQPETADTFTIGAVLRPGFIPGLSMSLDYYQIDISDAIVAQTSASILNQCETDGGVGPVCALVERPLPFSDRSPANVPTLIRTLSLNSATYKQNGLDADVSYRTPLAGGNLTVRAFLNYLFSVKTQSLSTDPLIDRVGYQVDPKLRATLSLRYEQDDWSIFVQERVTSKVKFGTGPVPPVAYTYDLPTVWYTDLTLTMRPQFASKYEGEVFLSVSNVFDQDPYNSGASLGGRVVQNFDPGRYDLVGRAFTLGFRMQM